jgi:hypothetical protein
MKLLAPARQLLGQQRMRTAGADAGPGFDHNWSQGRSSASPNVACTAMVPHEWNYLEHGLKGATNAPRARAPRTQ